MTETSFITRRMRTATITVISSLKKWYSSHQFRSVILQCFKCSFCYEEPYHQKTVNSNCPISSFFNVISIITSNIIICTIQVLPLYSDSDESSEKSLDFEDIAPLTMVRTQAKRYNQCISRSVMVKKLPRKVGTSRAFHGSISSAQPNKIDALKFVESILLERQASNFFHPILQAKWVSSKHFYPFTSSKISIGHKYICKI